jgi:hypothetical protein
MGKKINDQGDLEDDEENLDEEIRKAQQKELAELLRMLNKIKSFLLEYYKPVEDLTDPGAIHLSTAEIHQQLYSFYPTQELTASLVASWLNAAGFKFYDFGMMRFEWMLKKV